MNRDKALPYILAGDFLGWWKGMGEPEIQPAFHYWADQQELRTRRREKVWRAVGEMRRLRRAA